MLRGPLDPRRPWGIWNEDLKCYLKAVVPIDSDKVLLYFPKDNCCDMRGAIKLSKAVLPSVKCIETWAGDKVDMVYRRPLSENKWRAYDLRPSTSPSAGTPPPGTERPCR